MSSYREIASVVADARRSTVDPIRLPSDFVEIAVVLAESVGRTKEDLRRKAGYKTDKQFSRAANGEGTLRFARNIKHVLQQWGAEVSRLPVVVDDVLTGAVDSPWVREWLELGRRFYRSAPDYALEKEMKRFREMLEAAEKLAEGTDQHRRQTR